MIHDRLKKNGFILFIIPLIFNIPLTSRLPLAYFFPGDPIKLLVVLEIIFRIIVIIYSFFLIIDLEDNPHRKKGVITYLLGLIIYFSSWILLIVIEISIIENLHPLFSVLLVFGPAYTPIIWLIGMSLVCNDLKFILPSVFFIFFHVLQFVSIYIHT